MHESTNFPYILIGASAGGVYAMLEIAAALPPDFPAPILFVQHIGTHRSHLAQLLAGRGANRAIEASDGDRPMPGTIHVAPPDHHMLVERGRIRLTRGPKEHHVRPAIDPLFRSAALDLGPRAIGVILTGMLNDGSAGLRFVKQCGGIAVVQDPQDAVEASMPNAAIEVTAVDHVVPLAQMAPLLFRLASAAPVDVASTMVPGTEAPPDMRLEHSISSGNYTMEALRAIAQPSTFSCPDCGGVLFELHDRKPVRYRCHTGHAFSLLSLLATLEETTDVALWAAVRALREKEGLLRRLADMDSETDPATVAGYLSEADALARMVEAFRSVMNAAPPVAGIA